MCTKNSCDTSPRQDRSKFANRAGSDCSQNVIERWLRVSLTVDLGGIGTLVVAAFTALLALATFFMARATYKLVAEGQQQRKLLLYQTSAMRSQLDPLVKLYDWTFKENNLTIELENLGTGRAFWVGVTSWFDPCILRVSAEDEGRALTENEIKDLAAKGKKAWAEAVSLDTTKRLDYKDRRDVRTARMVSLLLNDRQGNEPILDAKERRVFTIEPHFVIQPRAGWRSSGWGWPFGGMPFNEMRDFLQSNHVRFAAIGFHVVCRNSIDDNVEGESFGYFVMFVSEDSTLELVQRRAFSHSLATIGERELSKLKYIDEDFYLKGRVPKPPQENPR